jgi:hypothetical protein
MIVTEEMVRGCASNSPCRQCVGGDCEYDWDELASLDCPTMKADLKEVAENMKNSGARLWRLRKNA